MGSHRLDSFTRLPWVESKLGSREGRVQRRLLHFSQEWNDRVPKVVVLTPCEVLMYTDGLLINDLLLKPTS